MGTVAATPASSAAAVTAALSFTGISTYSSDFQAILQREDAIAQLPITKLQNDQTDNLGVKQALIALNPVVSTLASSVAALGQLAAGQGLSATSSDTTSVSVVNTGATSPANYTISDITLGTAASELSLASYANATKTPIGVPGQNQFTLTVGATPYTLNITGNNDLAGLRDAINASGAPVNASILNSGNGNYLSINANNVGATTLTLVTAPTTANLITNTGSGSESSLAGYPDTNTTAVSSSGTVNLTVGGGAVIPLDISANNNLTGLMNAINGAGAGVTASISTSGGQNYLQLTAAGGPTTITLTDTPGAPASLITRAAQQGGNASFTLNGSIQVTNQATNIFNNVIPGVTFNLLQSTAGPVTLSLTTDPSQLTSALQTFVNSYNALSSQVTEETGTGAGALGGNSIVRDISTDLGQLSGYFGSSSTVRSLSDLGITFDNSGQMTLDPSVVSGFSNTQMSDAFKFFGSSNAGFAAFASNFTSLSDPISGSIQNQEDGIDAEDTNISSQITTLQARAALTHNANTARLEAADALVAQLESNKNTVSAEIQSIDFVDFGAPVSNA